MFRMFGPKTKEEAIKKILKYQSERYQVEK